MLYITKKITLLFFLLASGLMLHAQSLSHSVIGSAGNLQTASSGSNLHWTVGEVAVARYENDQSLWQGFHQMYYDLFLTPLWEVPDRIELNVFPNPTAGWLRVDNLSGEFLDITVSNLLGQTLARYSSGDAKTDLDLSRYSDGLYLISVYHNAQLIRTYKINKQQ